MPSYLLRKGQLQIGESAIAIIMVMIVLVIVAVIAFNNIIKKQEVLLTDQHEINAVETAQFVTGLYELRCAKTGMKTACVDIYKAKAFATLEETLDYYDQLRYATITLDQVYPAGVDLNGEDEPGTAITLYDQSIPASAGGQETITLIIPIAIHDPVIDALTFGTLTIKKHQAVII